MTEVISHKRRCMTVQTEKTDSVMCPFKITYISATTIPNVNRAKSRLVGHLMICTQFI